MTLENTSFGMTQVTSVSPVPSEIRLNPDWGQQFGHAWGLALNLPYGQLTSVFLDRRLTTADYDELTQWFESEPVVARVITCENKEWIIKIEPTKDGHFGLIISTLEGKPLIAGEGELTGTGAWHASFKTLYPGIRNRRSLNVQGGVRGGTGQRPEIQVGVTAEF